MKVIPPKHKAGFTLVELIIAVAISISLAALVVVVGQSRGRRDFDNGMKQILNNIKTVQNEAAAGLGPDVTGKCHTGNAADKVSGQCPQGELFGTAMVFSPPGLADIPAGMDFGSISSGGADLSRNYFSYRLAVEEEEVGRYLINSYGTSTKIAIPSGIGFRGSCIGASPGGTCNEATDETVTEPAMVVFAKIPSLNPLNENYSSSYTVSALQLTGYSFNAYDFTTKPTQYYVEFFLPTPDCSTQVDCDYSQHKGIIKLFFQDYTGRYNATISYDPVNNVLSLELQ